MKGVLLAGGTGSRLSPLTKATNKHLLPVYDKPMIYYPLNTLINMGIKDILIISGLEHCGHILQLLGSGKEFGIGISYEIQDEAGGIAQALGLAKDFADNSNIAVILGDNIYEEKFDISQFKQGARLFLKEVDDPKRFGVAEFKNDKLVKIEEKPKDPKSNYAVTGLYLYDNKVFDIIEKLKPSSRMELEITDVNNSYIQSGNIEYTVVKKRWTDAGTFESLFRAGSIARDIAIKKKELKNE
jgi:glucose-1-phosphate thymidylyltransferase